MSVGTCFAHKSQATFFGHTCLVVRRVSQALRGGATRFAQTHFRLFPCVARLLTVPPHAAQYLKLPLLIVSQTGARVFINSHQRCLTYVRHDRKAPSHAVFTSKSNSKKTTGTVNGSQRDAEQCAGKGGDMFERSELPRPKLLRQAASSKILPNE